MRFGVNPMKRKNVEEILKAQKDLLLRKYHVSKIGLFGSFVREEHTENSDIDILVEFTRPVGFEFIELKDYLESLFNRSVDLVTINALKPYMKQEILSEVQFQ
jgi:uncharacterized protein